jgi:hypothetical protein
VARAGLVGLACEILPTMPPRYSQAPHPAEYEPAIDTSGPTGPTPMVEPLEAGNAAAATEAVTAPSSANVEPFDERLWKAVASRADKSVADLVSSELQRLRVQHEVDENLLLVALYEPRQPIAAWQVDRLARAAKAANPQRSKDTLLVLRSGGAKSLPRTRSPRS